MSVGFVQQVWDGSGAASTKTTTISSTAGNTLVAILGKSGTSGITVSSITDSADNTWSKIASKTGSGSSQSAEMWWCPNAAAVTSITVNWSASCSFEYGLLEFSGMGTSPTIEKSTSNTNASSTTQVTGILAATSNTDLVLGMVSAGAETTIGTPVAETSSQSATYTNLSGGTHAPGNWPTVGGAYILAGAASSTGYGLQMTIGAAGGGNGIIVAITPSSTVITISCGNTLAQTGGALANSNTDTQTPTGTLAQSGATITESQAETSTPADTLAQSGGSDCRNANGNLYAMDTLAQRAERSPNLKLRLRRRPTRSLSRAAPSPKRRPRPRRRRSRSRYPADLFRKLSPLRCPVRSRCLSLVAQLQRPSR